MDIPVEDFDIETLSPRSLCFITGDSGVGKSVLLKDIVANVSKQYDYGIVCTDKNHKVSNYIKFIDSRRIYNRYSSTITSRCFFDNSYLIVDNCNLHPLLIDEIYDNYQGKKMVIALCTPKFCQDISFDFIFIGAFTNASEIYKIYCYAIEKFKISAEQFLEIIKECTKNWEFLVINCKALFFDELFMSYKPEKHDTLDLRRNE